MTQATNQTQEKLTEDTSAQVAQTRVHNNCSALDASAEALSSANATLKAKLWVEAIRPRTLPLSIAGGIIAAGLSVFYGCFDFGVCVFMLLTMLLLQMLSNIVDDLGDAENGADTDDRVGPKRALQRGELTKQEVKRGGIICAVASFVTALIMLVLSFKTNWVGILVFVGLEFFAVAGAVLYTNTKHAYGYIALGDASCALFFGVFEVVLGYYLYSHEFMWIILLPTLFCAGLITGVLNLNNMRDIETDAATGKRTVAGILGPKRALVYQYILVGAGLLGLALFPVCVGVEHIWCYLFLLPYVVIVKQLFALPKVTEPAQFDTFMKPLSLMTFVTALLFAICINL